MIILHNCMYEHSFFKVQRGGVKGVLTGFASKAR